MGLAEDIVQLHWARDRDDSLWRRRTKRHGGRDELVLRAQFVVRCRWKGSRVKTRVEIGVRLRCVKVEVMRTYWCWHRALIGI